ncbi:ammonia channel protein, partial [Telmatospirillum siberiense]
MKSITRSLVFGGSLALGLTALAGVGVAQEAAPAADAAAAAPVLDKADTAWMLTSTALVLLMT